MTKIFHTTYISKNVFSDMCGRNMETMQKTDWIGYSHEDNIALGLVITNFLKRQINNKFILPSLMQIGVNFPPSSDSMIQVPPILWHYHLNI